MEREGCDGTFFKSGKQEVCRVFSIKIFRGQDHADQQTLQKDADEKFVCNSRPRRFGKSVTADMLVAFFSRGTDSGALFEPLKCEKDALLGQASISMIRYL